ncbi:glutamate receptor ionotropic, kainate 5-like, partial [Centruroides sculpturatus]|uniref:glutamate receptor ionotropic, kainate 5-like n=1 Tax=Centruroides sculpturatus TaxID=218467 RepID=UPI000C6CB768
MLQEKLKFRYEVIQPMPKTVLQRHSNGSYYGMIAQIINKEADMSAIPLYLEKDVFDLADYSSITHMTPIHFIIKEQKLKPNWKTIFRPFTFECYIACVAASSDQRKHTSSYLLRLQLVPFIRYGMMSARMGQQYEVIQPMPKTVLQRHSNGSYYGMIAQIINKEADMSAIPLYLEKDVFDLADYSSITHMTPIHFIIKEQKLKPNWKTIFRPFTFEVWLTILISIVLTGTILSHIMKRANYLHGSRKYWSVKESIWHLFSNITLQGINLDRIVQVSSRIIIGVWLITVVVVGYGYSGILISFLTAPNYEWTPRNYHELVSAVESGDFSCGINIHAKNLHFKENESGMWKTLGDHINRKDNYLTVKNSIEKINSGRFALIESIGMINKIIRKELDGKIIISEDVLSTYSVGYVLRKNFLYKKNINKAIRRFQESGIIDFLKRKEETIPIYEMDNVAPLNCNELLGSFILLITGYVLSMICFVRELV